MSRLEYDVWLPGADLMDPPDAVLSTDDQLVDAAINPVTYGEGDGFLEIHANHPDAQFLQRRGTVRARDTISGFYLFWWILEEATKLTSKDEEVGKVIRWSGRGALILFDRYKLGHSIYAPGQLHRGDVDIPDYWTWNDRPIAAAIVRFVEEAQNHPDGNFLPDIQLNFTRTHDSAGNPWTELADYRVKIGTGGMTLLGDFLKAGGFLVVDTSTVPVLVSAYESITDYRTDRTSATFAINKVRFEAGVNIATEFPHKIAALRERTHNLTRRGDGDYQTFDGNGSGLLYMDFQDVPWTSDAATVEGASDWNLFQRLKQSTLAVVQHKIGDGGTDGEEGYMPGSHYWLGDLVTVHSGSGEYDLNEQPLEVAGIRLFMRGPDLMAEVQLGASIITAAGTPSTPVAGGGTTIIRSGIELCRPGTEPEAFSAVGLFDTAHSTSPNDVASGFWPGFWEEGLEITGTNVSVGQTLIGIVAWNRDAIGPNAGRDTAMYDSAGNTWILDTESSPVGNSDYIVQIWRCIVENPIPSSGYVRWAPKGPSVENDTDEYAAGRAFGVFIFNGKLIDPVVGATAGTFGSTHTVAAPAGDVVIGGLARHEGTVTGDGDWTAMIPWTEETSGAGVQIVGVFGQYKLNVSGENWVTTAGASKDWSGRAVGYTIGTALADQGDGRVELVGTSVRAKRCDDTEHFITDVDPTADDDETLGFRDRTLWLNTSTGAAFLASDVSAGAAVWEPFAGATTPTGTLVEGVYHHTTTQSVATATDVAVLFNTDVSDPGAMHDPSSNTSRIVVQAAQADRAIRIKAIVNVLNAGTVWQGWIRKNGTTPGTGTEMRQRIRHSAVAGITAMRIDETFDATEHVAGDWYEIIVRQASGGSLNIGSATPTAFNYVEVISG